MGGYIQPNAAIRWLEVSILLDSDNICLFYNYLGTHCNNKRANPKKGRSILSDNSRLFDAHRLYKSLTPIRPWKMDYIIFL